MKDLIIIGAGGMGREALFIAERMNEIEKTWNILGFLDGNKELDGRFLNGYEVFYQAEQIKGYETAYFICAIGASETRKKVVTGLQEKYGKLRFATLVDPSVILSPFVSVGEGSILAGGSVITVNIVIGSHVIVNMGCTIGHDAVLEDFVSLYPGVHLSGNTKVCEACEIGTGASVIQGLRLGRHSIIGAGTTVIREIPEYSTAVGCPAKVIKVRDKNREL